MSSSDSKGRKAKSLAYLANEFVKLIKSQENDTIDVMYAAAMLGVEKRRIYDITNALIGANVLQKQGKSSYKWTGGAVIENDGGLQNSYGGKDYYQHKAEELDVVISEFTKYMEKEYFSTSDTVLTTDELVESCTKNDHWSNDHTLIAISAPSGTDVYVTNNESGKDNEIYLSSPSGEIRTYLLPSNPTSQDLINENEIPMAPHTPELKAQPTSPYPVLPTSIENRLADRIQSPLPSLLQYEYPIAMDMGFDSNLPNGNGEENKQLDSLTPQEYGLQDLFM